MFSYFFDEGGGVKWGDVLFFEDARDISGIADVLHSWPLKFTADTCDDRIVIFLIFLNLFPTNVTVIFLTYFLLLFSQYFSSCFLNIISKRF